MNVAVRLGVYGVGLVVAFGGAFGAGRLLAPALPAVSTSEPAHQGSHVESDTAGDSGEHSAAVGLQTAVDGYALDLVGAPDTVGESAPLQIRITGPDGAPVTDFAEVHEKRLHLVVVARDGTGYQHLHPELDPSGVWSVALTLEEAGPYRVFADFRPTGHEGLVLGADLALPGDYRPASRPEPAPTTRVGDYTVELDGELATDAENTLAFTVNRDGEPVTDLQPHLGAYGHLVALRVGDLGYLHVHPGPDADPGPEIAMAVQAPSAGDYLLYLDFTHENKVHTAEFVVSADTEESR
ncbi:hypothetical protein [Nocardiopsis ansamitocini]|uniref:Secreted protein n=1 Tax=Nocardiopsis ansamitocini TaxID=1670832 RepID=A0A9W6ULH1_9ACTN|nr:hypothetical protein [Nocardiopsis ansamitocini]GLU50075.1 hypothetical protein Nans01_44260 [Nocardiopsis ansamitocini]